MTATKPTFTDKSLPYTIVGNDDAAVEGQKLHIYKKKGSVTIQFTGSAAQETYLRFTLKNYTDYRRTPTTRPRRTTRCTAIPQRSGTKRTRLTKIL